MWVIAMFDLPTDTRVARKAYARFRKDLLDDGFTMMQYSVYSRHCASIENADGHVGRMGQKLPSAGELRLPHDHRPAVLTNKGILGEKTEANRAGTAADGVSQAAA